MTKYMPYILLLAGLILLIGGGCTDRADDPGYQSYITGGGAAPFQQGGISPQLHVFFDELLLQHRNSLQLFRTATYLPRAAYPEYSGGRLEPVPLLVLLPPQDGDAFYYFNHGLKEIADEMIASGEIQPMAIACIQNDQVFGGYFYGTCRDCRYDYELRRFDEIPLGIVHYGSADASVAGGDWDGLIGRGLIDYLQTIYPVIIDDWRMRGIGGVGMGSYGAFRAAILSPMVFSSISVLDGPLDFDGPGGGGLLHLIDSAFAEQPWNDTTFKSFDTAKNLPVSRMWVGGSIAFSPHDYYARCSVWVSRVQGTDFLEEMNIEVVETQSFDSAEDSATLISDVTRPPNDLDFHLPFGADRNPSAKFWGMWMRNNLDSLLERNPWSLTGVRMWIATSPEAKWGYHEMTKSWIDNLRRKHLDCCLMVREYSGYSENPASDGQYVADLLREILRFHSQNFYPEQSAGCLHGGG